MHPLLKEVKRSRCASYLCIEFRKPFECMLCCICTYGYECVYVNVFVIYKRVVCVCVC